jgi:hypothetical protein
LRPDTHRLAFARIIGAAGPGSRLDMTQAAKLLPPAGSVLSQPPMYRIRCKEGTFRVVSRFKAHGRKKPEIMRAPGSARAIRGGAEESAHRACPRGDADPGVGRDLATRQRGSDGGAAATPRHPAPASPRHATASAPGQPRSAGRPAFASSRTASAGAMHHAGAARRLDRTIGAAAGTTAI